jgi:DNA-binding NtrC family response regulator
MFGHSYRVSVALSIASALVAAALRLHRAVTFDRLVPDARRGRPWSDMPERPHAVELHFPSLKKAIVIAAEEMIVDFVLERCDGSHKRAAAALGLDPANFRRLLRKFRAKALARESARTKARGPGIKKAIPRPASSRAA